MKNIKKFGLVLAFIFIFPVMILASPESKGIMTKTNLENKISREEVASIAIRLAGKNTIDANSKSRFKDVFGWSTDAIATVDKLGYMKGISKTEFKPKENISYIEFLTVIMRTMGYVDGIDLVDYPTGYYQKAVEIGLANIYIDPNSKITRAVAYESLEKALELKGELGENIKNPGDELTGEVEIVNIEFNSSVAPLIRGKVKNYKKSYKLQILNKNNKVLSDIKVKENGDFKNTEFPIDTISKIQGYKIVLKDKDDNILIEKDLN